MLKHSVRSRVRAWRSTLVSGTVGKRAERNARALEHVTDAPSLPRDSDATISVVVPVYRTPFDLFARMVRSVLAQSYGLFELVIVDDGGDQPVAQAYLERLGYSDDRLRVVHNGLNCNISAATNVGVEFCRGEYVAFIDHDDIMHPEALREVSNAIRAHDRPDMLYTDQVTVAEDGRIIHHQIKPDWSPTYLLGCMYVGHLLVARRSVAAAIRFDSKYDGVQDYEFILRASEQFGKIAHVPEILYSWGAVEGSIALSTESKTNIEALHREAVNRSLERRGLPWRAKEHETGTHRLTMKAARPEIGPKVSIIIPSKDLGKILDRCLRSIRDITCSERYEIVVVDNRTTDPIALAAIERYADLHVKYTDKEFNYSKANNLGVENSSGGVILFLNNDTEVTDPHWLQNLLMFLDDERVGMVGAKLVYPDGRVQHGGVVMGARGTADHVSRFADPSWDGYNGSLSVAREVAAVTAACMAISRETFEKCGGFCEDYEQHYQDVDLCLRVRELDCSIVYAAGVELVHYESVSRARDGYNLGDRAILLARWGQRDVFNDPYYPEAFSKETLNFTLREGLQ